MLTPWNIVASLPTLPVLQIMILKLMSWNSLQGKSRLNLQDNAKLFDYNHNNGKM